VPDHQHDQETTVQKSRVRNKTVYRPPPRRGSARPSPRWLVPTMLGCLVAGLAWIATYYVSQGSLPVGPLGAWNLVIGFVFIIGGVTLSTKWR
jgi:Cell division protein CrgA